MDIKNVQVDHAQDGFTHAARIWYANQPEEVSGERLPAAEFGDAAQDAHLQGRKLHDDRSIGFGFASEDEFEGRRQIGFREHSPLDG